jgi:glutamine cyclotransferase
MAARNRKGNNNNAKKYSSSYKSKESSTKNTETPPASSPSNAAATANSKQKKEWIAIMISMVCVIFAVVMARAVLTKDEASTSTTNTVPSSPTVEPRTLEPTPHMLAVVGRDYQVLKVIPHDEKAFTQGLFIHEGNFVEGTGNYGESVVRIYDIEDGTIRKEVSMDNQYFGEGITSFTTNVNQDDHGASTTRLVQLTYKKQTGFIYDIDTLEVVQEFRYTTNTTEGWGITFDAANHELLVSDGSEWIHVWDATTLQEKRRYAVTFQSELKPHQPPMAAKHLNELEFDAASGTLLANVWYQNVLLRIDPVTGQVLRVYDMAQLYPSKDRSPKADCFNGIAIVPETPNEVWVTGKWWPHMYLVKLLA